MEARRPRVSTSLSALWVIRGLSATCLFETSRRAEATVSLTRQILKESNVGLSFYGDYQPARAGQQTYYTRSLGWLRSWLVIIYHRSGQLCIAVLGRTGHSEDGAMVNLQFWAELRWAYCAARCRQHGLGTSSLEGWSSGGGNRKTTPDSNYGSGVVSRLTSIVAFILLKTRGAEYLVAASTIACQAAAPCCAAESEH
jgi:hypothetical protein